MSERQYSVTVTIHQTNNIKIPNKTDLITNQYITVSCGNKTFATPVKNNTSSAIYNFKSIFFITADIDDLILQNVDISVYHKYKINSYLVGKICINLATIYLHNNCELYTTWLNIIPAAGHGSNLSQIEILNLDVGQINASIKIEAEEAGIIPTSAIDEKEFINLPYNNAIIYKNIYEIVLVLHKANYIVDLFSLGEDIWKPYFEIQIGEYVFHTKVDAIDVNPNYDLELHIPIIEHSLDNFLKIKLCSSGMLCSTVAIETICILDYLGTNEKATFWLNFNCNINLLEIQSNTLLPNIDIGELLSTKKKTKLSKNWKDMLTSLVADNIGINIDQSITVRLPLEESSYTTMLQLNSGQDTSFAKFKNINKLCARLLISISTNSVEDYKGFWTASHASLINLEAQKLLLDTVLYELVRPNSLNISKTHLELSISTAKVRIDSLNFSRGYKPSTMVVFVENFLSFYTLFACLIQNNNIIAWCDVRPNKLMQMLNTPTWLSFKSMNSSDKVIRLCLAFYISGDYEKIIPPQFLLNIAQQTHIDYDTVPYIFRCFIYEANNLRSTESITSANLPGLYLPNPYVMIEFTGKVICSQAINSTTLPQYFQAYEITVNLPKHEKLRENITISILSKNLVGRDDEFIGKAIYEIQDVPEQWKKAPEWISIYNNKTGAKEDKDYVGSLLISFELLPNDKKKLYPFFNDILPSTYESHVQLYIDSLTLYKTKQQINSIRIAYGRELKDTIKPLWKYIINKPQAIVGNVFQYKQHVDAYIEIPKRNLNSSYFEILIQTNVEILIAHIPLNIERPWLSEADKAVCRQLFTYKDEESVLVDQQHQKKLENIYEYTNNHDQKSDLIDYVDIIGKTDVKKLKLALPNNSEQIASKNIFYISNEIDISTLNNINSNNGNNDNSAESIIEASFTDKIYNIGLSKLLFNVDIDETEIYEDERKETINYPLEMLLSDEQSKYNFLNIYRTIKKSYPRKIGKILYSVIISAAEEAKRIIPKSLPQCTVEIRLYLIDAYKLQFKTNQSSVFHIEVELLGLENKKQLTNTMTKLQFNKLFTFIATLPFTNTLALTLYQKLKNSDEIIGTTYIDVCERYYNEHYQKLLLANEIPIETRSLFDETSSHTKGLIRCWLEIYDENYKNKLPIALLSSPEPKLYELRLCLLSIDSIYTNESLHLQVGVKYTHDIDNEEEQFTDINYNTTNSSARYNWRTVFTIYIPATYKILTIRIYSVNWLGLNGVVKAEGIYDLANELELVKRQKKNDSYYKENLIIQCTDTSNKFFCNVNCILSILQKDNANMNPVGVGRNEPNKNPYLEPIYENRSYIDWSTVSINIKNLGSFMFKTTKWVIIIIIVVGVLFLIIALVVIFKTK